VNFVSRWVVGERQSVDAADLDADGTVRRSALERWIDSACTAYVTRCSTLERDTASPAARITALPDAPVTGSPARVIMSAGATELLPAAVVVAVRLRFTGGHDDQVVNARCEVTLRSADGSAEPLGDDVRAELIALEHAATFTN
jgi:hypothetical protein